MTEPTGVDAAMERLQDAIGRWQPATADGAAASPGTASGIYERDIEQLIAEVHRLRATGAVR